MPVGHRTAGHSFRIMTPCVTGPNKLANVVREEPATVAMGQPNANACDLPHRSIGLIVPRSLGAVKIGRGHVARAARSPVHAPRIPSGEIQPPHTCGRFRTEPSGRADPAWS